MDLIDFEPLRQGELVYQRTRGEVESLEEYDSLLEMEKRRKERLESSLYRNRVENTLAERRTAQCFADTLIRAPLVPIRNSNDMHLLFGLPVLETGEAGGAIVVRSISTAFWNSSIDMVHTSQGRVLVMGVPGVGKTTTTPLLIRELLLRGQNVVYHIKSATRTKWYYQFIPTRKCGKVERVEAEVFHEKLDLCDIPSLGLNSTYYIVDPSHTKDDCNPPPGFPAKVIIVALSDSCHWGGSYFGRQRGLVSQTGIKMGYPQWSCEELVAAQPILDPALDATTVRARFRLFGGIQRNVFCSNEAEQDQIQEQDLALNELTFKGVAMITSGTMDAMDTFASGEPKSVLMGFFPRERTFSSKRADLLSDAIRDKLYARWLGNVCVKPIHCFFKPQGRSILHAYVRSLLTSRNMWHRSFDAVRIDGEESNRLCFPHCKDARVVPDPVSAVATCGAPSFVLFHSSIGSFETVDCIFKDDENKIYAIQTVVSRLHCVGLTATQKLQSALGCTA
jgi:DNA polymerase III delta prime subunit